VSTVLHADECFVALTFQCCHVLCIGLCNMYYTPRCDAVIDAVIVDEIRAALYQGYELVVVGREKKVQYGSPEERTAWLYTAELFIR